MKALRARTPTPSAARPSATARSERAQAARFSLRRNDCRSRYAPRRAVIGPRRQDRPLESGKEQCRQREDREHVDRELQNKRRCGDHRLQRHDDDQVEEINRIRDAAEIEARAPDDSVPEKVLGQPDGADRDHAERRRDIRKRPLGQRVAADGQDRDAELGRDRNRKQREQRARGAVGPRPRRERTAHDARARR